MSMVWYSGTDPWLSKMQDLTALMLHWRKLLRGDSDMRTTVFAHNGGHYIGYAIKSLPIPWIIQNETPIMVNCPLTLIFKG